MSLNDLLAYASWSGLRPMSELEYERACRAPFPQDPLAGEYPWNSNGGVSRVTGLVIQRHIITGNTLTVAILTVNIIAVQIIIKKAQ